MKTQRKPISFRGWKIGPNEIISPADPRLEDHVGEHEAHKVRDVLKIKGKMTPQYSR